MKFIKKVAALCFCAALALSVMAISASATGSTITVTLVKNTAAGNEYYDYDNNNFYEVHKGTESNNPAIVYDIQLKGGETSVNVNAVAFEVYQNSLPEGVTFAVFKGGSGMDTLTANEQDIYTIYPGQTANTDDDISVGVTAVTVGRIVYTIGNGVGAESAEEFTPAITSVSVAQRDSTTLLLQAEEAEAPIGVEVNPRYTVTFKDFESDADGTKKAIEYDETENPAESVEYSYSDGGTLVYQTNKYATGLGVTAYAFKGWKVASNGDVEDTETANGWKAVDGTYLLEQPAQEEDGNPTNELTNTTIPTDCVGNITLEAIYDAKTYTVTFAYDNDVNGNGITSTALTDISYTIENVANSTSNTNPLKAFVDKANPTWTGFSFDKWTMKPTISEDTDYSTAVWGTIPSGKTEVDFTKTQLSDFVGAYGNVTLKAYCKEDGVWTAVNYAYAYNTDSLILYAVETPVSGAVYKCDGKAMFIVPTSKYYQVDKFASASVSSSYTIYAYLGATTKTSDELNRPPITIDVSANKGDPNVDLTAENTYNGNVLNDAYVDAGDLGLVNSILVSKATSGDGVFDNTALGMRFRLLMDMASKLKSEADGGGADFSSEKNVSFGSIEDIKAIADLVGTSVTAVS